MLNNNHGTLDVTTCTGWEGQQNKLASTGCKTTEQSWIGRIM